MKKRPVMIHEMLPDYQYPRKNLCRRLLKSSDLAHCFPYLFLQRWGVCIYQNCYSHSHCCQHAMTWKLCAYQQKKNENYALNIIGFDTWDICKNVQIIIMLIIAAFNIEYALNIPIVPWGLGFSFFCLLTWIWWYRYLVCRLFSFGGLWIFPPFVGRFLLGL